MGCRKHSPGNPCCGCTHECGVYQFPPAGAEYPMTLTITGNHPIVLSGNLVFDSVAPPDCIASACVTFEPSNVWTKVFKVKKACTDQFHYEQEKLCCPLVGAATLEPWLDYDISIVAATAATYRASIKYTQLCLRWIPSKYRNDYPDCNDTLACGGIRVEACLHMKTNLSANTSVVMQMEVKGTAVTLPCFDPEDIETVDVLFDCSDGGDCDTYPSPGVSTAPGYPSTPAEVTDAGWDALPECTVSRSYFLVSEFSVLDSLTFAPSPYIEFAYGEPVPTLDLNCNSNVVEPCVDSQCAEASYFEACTETEQTETECTKSFLCNGVTTTYDGFIRNIGYYGCGLDLYCLDLSNCGGTILNEINGVGNEFGGDGPCSLGVVTGRTTSCTGETLDNIADGDAIFDPYADPWYVSITI